MFDKIEQESHLKIPANFKDFLAWLFSFVSCSFKHFKKMNTKTSSPTATIFEINEMSSLIV